MTQHARPGMATPTDAVRRLAAPPLFDAARGETILLAENEGQGWWVGAPSVVRTEAGYYLSYRVRRPRGQGRGVLTRIAHSSDGRQFNDVWEASKAEFDSESIERSALVALDDGRFRLYVSYVDPADRRWRIDVMTADDVRQFDPATRQKVLVASDVPGLEAVKDPVVFQLGGIWQMILSASPMPPDLDDDGRARLHETADIYATGLSRSVTGLATSEDGLSWTWQGTVLEPAGSGWDAYATRISAVLFGAPLFIGYYDGSRDVTENYEERTGVCWSFDLRTWHRATTAGPTLVSPHAGGSLRYIDVLSTDEGYEFFYEYARPGGSHAIGRTLVPRGDMSC